MAPEVCRLAVLYPPDLDYTTLPAGVLTRLADDIWRQSAMPGAERLVVMLDAFRQQMESFERQAECVIATAFPQIRPEEMLHWPVVKLIDYAARAEWTLNNVHRLPVQFARLDEEAGKQQAKPDPQALRKRGVDPMLLLDPRRLRPNMVHNLFIVGTSGWKQYNCQEPTTRPSQEQPA